MSEHRLFRRSILLLIGAGTLALFHWQGNTADVHIFGQSVFAWMVHRWNDYGGRYSHCYLIPLISIAALWRNRKQIRDEKKSTDILGLVLIVLSLMLHLAGARARMPRLSLLAFIGVLWGIPCYLQGRRTARHLLFPCAYLVFCIPLTFLDSMTFPLRLFAAQTASLLLNGVGVETFRRGTALLAPNGGFSIDIADPCSGLRSFLALTSLTAAYAYFFQKSQFRKWLLFLCAPVVAVVSNITRIMAIALVAVVAGQRAAMGLYHDCSGYVVFTVAVVMITGLGRVINADYRTMVTLWKHRR